MEKEDFLGIFVQFSKNFNYFLSHLNSLFILFLFSSVLFFSISLFFSPLLFYFSSLLFPSISLLSSSLLFISSYFSISFFSLLKKVYTSAFSYPTTATVASTTSSPSLPVVSWPLNGTAHPDVYQWFVSRMKITFKFEQMENIVNDKLVLLRFTKKKFKR